MNKTFSFVILTLLSLGLINLVSCVKDDFDAPPSSQNPTFDTATVTIEQLLSLYDLAIGGDAVEIPYDYIVQGVVVSDDKAGNFYKSLIIQDETAGIAVRIDATDLFNDFPTGRRVFVKCKGLYLGAYNNLYQLGYEPDNEDSRSVEAIPEIFMDNFVFPGELNQELPFTEVTISELLSNLNAYQNELVRIPKVEFISSDKGVTFADAENNFSQNLTIQDCEGNQVLLRTSGFADFAGSTTPDPYFNMMAILQVYQDDAQLLIRNLEDIEVTGSGCNALFREDFESLVSGMDADLDNWTNVSEQGTAKWEGDDFNFNVYARASAYGSGDDPLVMWLVTPPIDLDNSINEVLTFRTLDAFDNGATLQAYISTDHDGGATPWTATWDGLGATIAGGTTSGFGDWVDSGPIDLNSYSGNVYIAWRYSGANTGSDPDEGQTTTFQLDDVQIVGE